MIVYVSSACLNLSGSALVQIEHVYWDNFTNDT